MQLFLFKKYNFLPSRRHFYLNQSNLLNKRLPIFESLSENLLNKSNQNELYEHKYNNEIIDKNNSFSTISNTSNEEVETKKYNNNNNDLDLAELVKNDEKEKNIKEKLSNKLNDKALYNQIDKENICDNINF